MRFVHTGGRSRPPHRVWQEEDAARQLKRRVALEEEQRMVQLEQQIAVQRQLMGQVELKRRQHEQKMASGRRRLVRGTPFVQALRLDSRRTTPGRVRSR